MSKRKNPAFGMNLSPEESKRIVGELSIMAALQTQEATGDEMLLIWECIPKLLAILRSRKGEGFKFAIMSESELRVLIAGLDGQRNDDTVKLRAQLAGYLDGRKA
jgi:hypothetical protein